MDATKTTPAVIAAGNPGAIVFQTEAGALIEVPIYENHKRGTNWCAVIGIDPTSPGGLSRQFFQKAKGEYYYIIPPALKAGDALEFGADYTSSGGNRRRARYYCVVLRVLPDAVQVQRFETGKGAIKGAVEAVERFNNEN